MLTAHRTELAPAIDKARGRLVGASEHQVGLAHRQQRLRPMLSLEQRFARAVGDDCTDHAQCLRVPAHADQPHRHLDPLLRLCRGGLDRFSRHRLGGSLVAAWTAGGRRDLPSAPDASALPRRRRAARGGMDKLGKDILEVDARRIILRFG
eukprot:3546033-Prymnesium_polylepis.1